MHLKPEDEAENLKMMSDIELQKLSVVPQTVFLKSRLTEIVPRTSCMSYLLSIDYAAPGAPFEDLRCQLTAINGSVNSLPSATLICIGMHQLSLSAGADSQKVAPAINYSRESMTGLLEPTSHMHSEGSPERSGCSLPVSATGTVQGQCRQWTPPVSSILTYDGQEPGVNNQLKHLYLNGNSLPLPL
ncbi:hypothetical protein EWM64_g9198 [Hericium alpestre]|uniref:Uncharacterized protein n=1 Tax=Hericium alpestre TaxID=135208 RepID=A0A4Y9ZK36_9AGAM|nr:hypothetical protein EWM64_g9198 [Hericium alpestre]